MSGVDPNGGGPLLVPGGAAAPPEGTGLTSVTAGEWDTPSTLAARVAADAAALRAILDATRTTTPSLASTSGWTNSTSGTGATSTQNTSTGQMEFAVNNNGGTARFLRTISVPSDWRAQVRVRSFSDTTVNVQATFSVYQSASPTEGPRFTVYGDGSLRTQYVPFSGSTVTVRAQTTAISAVRAAMTAGTLWMRMQSQGGCIGWLYAVGATESSLSWVTFGAYALPGSTDGERTPDTYNVSLNRVSSSGAQTATVDSISYRDLSP